MGLLRSLAKKVLGRPEPARSPAAPAPATSAPTGAASPSSTDKPWYLDGTNDGWDTTDVKPDPLPKSE